jgi:hypothetical protein
LFFKKCSKRAVLRKQIFKIKNYHSLSSLVFILYDP